jgi:hypothetical protein
VARIRPVAQALHDTRALQADVPRQTREPVGQAVVVRLLGGGDEIGLLQARHGGRPGDAAARAVGAVQGEAEGERRAGHVVRAVRAQDREQGAADARVGHVLRVAGHVRGAARGGAVARGERRGGGGGGALVGGRLAVPAQDALVVGERLGAEEDELVWFGGRQRGCVDHGTAVEGSQEARGS